jgi:hypothetical protein
MEWSIGFCIIEYINSPHCEGNDVMYYFTKVQGKENLDVELEKYILLLHKENMLEL